MRTLNFTLFTLLLLFAACTSKISQPPPQAVTKSVYDTLYGMVVEDQYRYMEDLSDSSVIQWIKSQSEYTRGILDRISGRTELVEQMKEFDSRRSETVYNLHITDNDKYFYLKSTPDDETGKLFFREGFSGDEQMLFDPETYKDDTLMYSITSLSPFFDGSKIAFTIAPNGSEMSELLIMKVPTKEFYPEVIDRARAAYWLASGEELTYLRLNSTDVLDMNNKLNTKSYLHSLGVNPDQDLEVFSAAKYPELNIQAEEIPTIMYDKDTEKLLGFINTVDNRLKVFIAPAEDIRKEKIRWRLLMDKKDEIYNFSSFEDDLYVYTPKNAPNFKLLKTSLSNPDYENAEVLVAEQPDAKLESYTVTADGVYYSLSRNGVEESLYFIPHGTKEARKIELPTAAGTIRISSKGFKFADVWVTLTGWTIDFKRYRYNLEQDEFTVETLSAQAEYPEYDDVIAEEVMVVSHDGVEVPLSLIYNKNLKRNGKNPVFIYGYGAYGYSISPRFSPTFFLPATKGAVFAIAHIRGGGELGDSWYRAGYKTTKPNTWKDLIACAEYLVNENYTSPQKIAIDGGSAGGILIGRAMTERPDLFGAAIPEVGVMNTMRAEFTPNGPVNIPEFGTIKDSVECMALYEMDSYQHIETGISYPATLITAGMNDPRVIAWQPAKFAAKLQAANVSDNPILLLVDFESGHGIGDTKTKYFESLADVQSFALWQTGHADFKLK